MQINLKNLTDDEQEELLFLLEQRERERVTPKMEAFRDEANRYRILMARGGRGAGAKSTGCASILIQKAHYHKLRIVCLREIQRSLEESSYRLMVDTIDRLGYPGWKITREHVDSPSGSRIIFRGLADLRAANQIKGLEGLDIAWIDEASAVSEDSLRLLLPTLRKEKSKLYITYNPETEYDPVTTRLWNIDRDDVLKIELEQGKIDNEWFNNTLQKEMEEDYKRNPDEALHTWGGQPRKQGQNAVMSRVAIRAAVNRPVEETEPDEVGVDVARFGNDKTQMYRRRGAKVIAHKELSKADTQIVAKEVWEFAGRDHSVAIKVDDTGVGGGVTDRLNEFKANVIPVNFGGSPNDKSKYDTAADEMWFEFPVEEASIPDDSELLQELGGRLYDYDKFGRRKVEQKKKFRERFGRSPDKADALLLCYYVVNKGARFSDDIRNQMAARRGRRGDD